MRAPFLKQTILILAILGVVCSAGASDADIQAIANQISQPQYTEFQHTVESMGLGSYGGTLYNQSTRGRSYPTAPGDKGNQEARKYVFEKLSGLGLSTAIHGKFYNVVAEQLGATNPQNVLFIAAHYDTLKSNTPGGDGDASGTAGVLEAARVLSQYKFDSTIRYVVFNTTSKAAAGSNDYANHIIGIFGEKVLGVVYLDEILHPYHDKNSTLPPALAVGVADKTATPTAWGTAFTAAAKQFVPTLALNSSGLVVDSTNDAYSFITYGYLATARLSENSSKDIANASLNTAGDASDGAAGAHYDFAFATDVVRATAAFIAQQAGYLGLSDGSISTFSDSDGDGFSDEIELALGSDPASAASTPMGLPPASPAGLLETTGMGISIDFTTPSSDIVSVFGLLPIHAGFDPKSAVAIVDVAGIVKAFTLNASGAGKKGTDGFTLKIKSSGGATTEQLAQYVVSLNQGNFKKQLGALGLTNSNFKIGRPVAIPVTIVLANEVRRTTRILTYVSTKDTNGIAK